MGLLRLTIVFVTLHLTAASSSTCPSSAPTKQSSQPQALIQRRHSVEHRALKVEANTSDNSRPAVEAKTSDNIHEGGGCPWAATTEKDWQLQCVDGTLCDSWSCCAEHGGRWKCPPNRPLMCEEKRCTGGSHCCRTHCRGKYGGLRTCPAEGVCPYRGTTATDDEFECADGTTCTQAGCCRSIGGVAKCPMNAPLMCADKTCSGDHCCKTNCADFGGIRSCPTAPSQVLMFGNSFTHYNNGVDAVLRNFFTDAGKPTMILALTKGGAHWGWHLDEAVLPGSEHFGQLMIPGPGAGGYAVVQEQSYIPGTCCQDDGPEQEFLDSEVHLSALDKMIEGIGSQTVLYQTFGWRDGHSSRSYLSDFPKFNEEVKLGYMMYEQLITNATSGRKPLRAPVGDAFKIIYDDGSAPGSLFYRLYDADARHPGPLGTYLAGCVVYSTITGKPSVGLPAPGISAEDAADLQTAADVAVFAQR